MPLEQSNIKERSNTRIQPPSRYTVFFHNDDFTPMDFVVFVLMFVFKKSQKEAFTLMLSVHHSDKAPVGTYSYDVAHTRVAKATKMAREHGYPLRLSVEKA